MLVAVAVAVVEAHRWLLQAMMIRAVTVALLLLLMLMMTTQVPRKALDWLAMRVALLIRQVIQQTY